MNIFQTFKQSSTKEIIGFIIFFLSGIFCLYINFSLIMIFLSPEMECSKIQEFVEENNQQIFLEKCTMDEACNSNRYQISEQNKEKSLITQFNILCDRKKIDLAQSILFIVLVIPPLLFMFVIIKPSQRAYFLTDCYIVSGILCIFTIYSNNFWIIVSLVFITRLIIRSWIIHCYVYINENFNQHFAKIIPGLSMLGYSLYTIGTGIFHKNFPDWKKYLLYWNGYPFLILGFIGFLYTKFANFKPQEENDIKSLTLKNYVISADNIVYKKGNFQGILRNKTYFINWLIFTFQYRAVSFQYFMLLLILDKLSGGFEMNLILMGLVDFFTCQLTVFLISKYDGIFLLRWSFYISAIGSLLYFLQGIEGQYISYILILSFIIVKMQNQSIGILAISCMDAFVPLKLQQSFWASSSTFDIVTVFIPFLITFIEKYINVNPLALFSIFMLIGGILTYKFRLIASTGPGVYALPDEIIKVKSQGLIPKPNILSLDQTLMSITSVQMSSINQNIELQVLEKMQRVYQKKQENKKQSFKKMLLEEKLLDQQRLSDVLQSNMNRSQEQQKVALIINREEEIQRQQSQNNVDK